jgi:hypothetical protein
MPRQLRQPLRIRLARRQAERVRHAADSTYTFWAQTRKWLRTRRLWWRHRYVPGAPYPPHFWDEGVKFAWRKDIRAGFTNPPRH